MGCVDTKFLKVLDCRWTEQVASDSRHHKHVRATKPGSGRLIRALTSESEIEFLSEDRFPGLRKLIGEGCQIDVGTANDRNTRAPGHGFLSATA
jgi:hypothetical protein